MPGPPRIDALHSPDHAQVIVPCTDLESAIAFYTGKLGFRLDMIMPADAPRVAVLSGAGIALRLEFTSPPLANHTALTLRLSGSNAWFAAFEAHELAAPDGVRILLVDEDARIAMPVAEHVFLVSRANDGAIVAGRAGMSYRDLIPGRLGGRYIASHIRIIAGGPAEHETVREHAFDLPTARLEPERNFSGQRFVRHVAADATWQPCAGGGFEYRDTGIAEATAGLASVRVLRARPVARSATVASRIQSGRLRFLSVLAGRLAVRGSKIGAQQLDSGDACVIPSDSGYVLDTTAPCEVLEVEL